MRKVVPIDEGKIRVQLCDAVRDTKRLLGDNIIRARRTLRRLLVGKIECVPFMDGKKKRFRFKGALALGRLLDGEVLTRLSVVRGAEC